MVAVTPHLLPIAYMIRRVSGNKRFKTSSKILDRWRVPGYDGSARSYTNWV
jgi:hypothetical protein